EHGRTRPRRQAGHADVPVRSVLMVPDSRARVKAPARRLEREARDHRGVTASGRVAADDLPAPLQLADERVALDAVALQRAAWNPRGAPSAAQTVPSRL